MPVVRAGSGRRREHNWRGRSPVTTRPVRDYRSSHYARARTATPPLPPPACRSIRAASPTVLPVVITSSTSRTVRPVRLARGRHRNAPRMLASRAEADGCACWEAGFTRRSHPAPSATPSEVASSRATASAWLYPRASAGASAAARVPPPERQPPAAHPPSARPESARASRRVPHPGPTSSAGSRPSAGRHKGRVESPGRKRTSGAGRPGTQTSCLCAARPWPHSEGTRSPGPSPQTRGRSSIPHAGTPQVPRRDGRRSSRHSEKSDVPPRGTGP